MTHHWIWQYTKWPQFTWQEEKLLPLLVEARKVQGQLLGSIEMLDTNLSAEAQAEILVTDGVNTSAIEGEQIDPSSIRSSIARHLGLPTAGLPQPARNVEGLVQVLLDATQHYDQPLTLQRLCGWQAALFPTGYSGLSKIKTGELRGSEPMRVVSGPIGREKIHFEAPPQKGLSKQVNEFIHWFNKTAKDKKFDGLVRAGITHLWFVTLHPFEDGNGRLARALTDMAIAQDEKSTIRTFSLSAQMMRTRSAYYDILESTQKNSLDITPWLAWFLQQIVAACALAQKTIHHVLQKARFWMQHSKAPMNDRQRKIMNRLLDAGPEGFKGGMNTRKYMSLTKTSRATAYRELNELVEWKCLSPVGQGRSTGYVVNFEDG